MSNGSQKEQPVRLQNLLFLDGFESNWDPQNLKKIARVGIEYKNL